MMHPQTEVVLYHNIIGPKYLAFLRNDTERHFNVSAYSSEEGTLSYIRLSATSYLSRNKGLGVTERLLKLVSRATGLSTLGRELFLHSYPPGGHFALHADSVSENFTTT